MLKAANYLMRVRAVSRELLCLSPNPQLWLTGTLTTQWWIPDLSVLYSQNCRWQGQQDLAGLCHSYASNSKNQHRWLCWCAHLCHDGSSSSPTQQKTGRVLLGNGYFPHMPSFPLHSRAPHPSRTSPSAQPHSCRLLNSSFLGWPGNWGQILKWILK